MLDSAVKPCYNLTVSPIWRDVRAVEGARLESVYTGNCIKGSNPFLSGQKKRQEIGISWRFSFCLLLHILGNIWVFSAEI